MLKRDVINEFKADDTLKREKQQQQKKGQRKNND